MELVIKKMIMNRNIKIIILCLIFASCNNENILITNNGIGNLKIGMPLREIKYDKESFEIISNEDNIIKSIVISNPKYKTKNGFGIGSDLKIISEKLNIPINENLKASKGKIHILDLGKSIFYDNIFFMDSNKDYIVDQVIINGF